ncbi:MAG: hypothetical protein CMJ59_11500 [Planctomycetaceae bacterium]|nr:hypothetical protein [Planctomycetaceae bacterium]
MDGWDEPIEFSVLWTCEEKNVTAKVSGAPFRRCNGQTVSHDRQRQSTGEPTQQNPTAQSA